MALGYFKVLFGVLFLGTGPALCFIAVFLSVFCVFYGTIGVVFSQHYSSHDRRCCGACPSSASGSRCMLLLTNKVLAGMILPLCVFFTVLTCGSATTVSPHLAREAALRAEFGGRILLRLGTAMALLCTAAFCCSAAAVVLLRRAYHRCGEPFALSACGPTPNKLDVLAVCSEEDVESSSFRGWPSLSSQGKGCGEGSSSKRDMLAPLLTRPDRLQ